MSSSSGQQFTAARISYRQRLRPPSASRKGGTVSGIHINRVVGPIKLRVRTGVRHGGTTRGHKGSSSPQKAYAGDVTSPYPSSSRPADLRNCRTPSWWRRSKELERRRRRGQRRAGPPGCDLGGRADRRDRRRGVLRLPGEPARDPPDRRRHAGLVWPSMRISHSPSPGSSRDVVLMHGVGQTCSGAPSAPSCWRSPTISTATTVVILGRCWPTPHTPAPFRCQGAAYSSESGEVLRS